MSVYKNGSTTTVFLYAKENWLYIDLIKRGFISMRLARDTRKKPEGCLGYIIYNTTNYSVIHDCTAQETSLKLSMFWQRYYFDEEVEYMAKEDLGGTVFVYIKYYDLHIGYVGQHSITACYDEALDLLKRSF